VTVPDNAQPGEYVVPVTIDAKALMLTAAVPKLTEVTVTGNGWVFVVVQPQPPEYPPFLVFMFVLLLTAVAIGLALIVHAEKKR